MDTQTEARIYLAGQRGYSETDTSRSYHSFNFGRYSEESRQPFGTLQLLNDDTLRAGASLTMRVEQATAVILIPVTGGLEHSSDGLANEPATRFLEPGQVQILALSTGMSYVVSNPYETESIRFLQLWLTTSTDFPATSRQSDFDLTHKNKLLPLFGLAGGADNRGLIGQYEGRQQGVYRVEQSATGTPNGVFVFVLRGAFEVQNRLLHEKDGLALLGMQDGVIEFEALSNAAILLLLDVPVDPSQRPDLPISPAV